MPDVHAPHKPLRPPVYGSPDEPRQLGLQFRGFRGYCPGPHEERPTPPELIREIRVIAVSPC